MDNDQNFNKAEEDVEEDDFNIDPFEDIEGSDEKEEEPKPKKLKKMKEKKKSKKNKQKKLKKKKKIEQQLEQYGQDEEDDYDDDNEMNSMFEDEAESDDEAEDEEDISAEIDEDERRRFNEQYSRKRATDNYFDRFQNKNQDQINRLYSKQVYKRRENQDLYPGEKDPKLFVVNVKPRHEEEMVLVILNKARHLANTANKVTIISALAMKKHPGRIFVEAMSEKDVRQSLEGFNKITLTRKINELDTDSYANLFSQKVQNKVTFKENSYVRIKKGLYEGDLGKICKVKANSVDVLLVPRINIQDIVMKIREQTSKMIDPQAIKAAKQNILKLFTNHRTNYYRQRPNKNPIMEQNLTQLRDIPGINAIRLANINGLIILNYKFDEVNKVTGTYLPIQVLPFSRQGNVIEEIKEDRKSFITGANFKKGEEVEIIAGELAKSYGIILDIRENIGVIRCSNKEMKGEIVEEPLEHLAKRFKQNQRVKVISGADMGKTGIILSVQPKIVQIWTDNGNSIKINKKNLELHHGEVICEENVHGLKKDNLIKTSKGTVGIVIETKKDSIKILDVNNTLQIISNMDFDSVLNTRNFTAKNNRLGEEITSGSTVIIAKGIHEGKRCKVIHVYLQYVFLFNQGFDRTAGVSVQIADNLSLIAKRDTNNFKSMSINNKNKNFGVSQQNEGEDLTVGKTITLRTGPLKGYQGVIKSINKDKIEVRVPSKSCTVSVPREKVGAKSETLEIGKTPNRRGGPAMTHIYAASPMNKY